MSRMSRRPILGGLAALAVPRFASAQGNAPGGVQAATSTRPITIVVPFAPGGSTDVISRLLGERMAAILGQPVQVENRPGANTIIGAEHVARAQPDGHTILMAAGSTLTINPVVQRNLPYKVEDFAPITLATTLPFAVVVRPGGPADIAAWVAAAKAQPGRLTYGTNGPTTLTNVAMLVLLDRLGLTMQDVTYRGDSAQLTDFLAGNLDYLIVAGSTAVPVHQQGQGRIIGWTGPRRMPSTPEVPTFAEAAPGLEVLTWFGLLAPARTPEPMIRRLNAAAVQALAEPRVHERLTRDAQFVVGSSPAGFAEFLREQDRLWRPILARLEVRTD